MKSCHRCQRQSNDGIEILNAYLCRSCKQEIYSFMTNPRETDYSAKILSELRSNHGALCLSLAGSYFQEAGWPDAFIACKKYKGFIEFKGRDTALRKLQAFTIKQLQRHGVNCYVVRFVEFKPNLWDITDETGKVIQSVVSHTLSEGVIKLLDVLANITTKVPTDTGEGK